MVRSRAGCPGPKQRMPHPVGPQRAQNPLQRHPRAPQGEGWGPTLSGGHCRVCSCRCGGGALRGDSEGGGRRAAGTALGGGTTPWTGPRTEAARFRQAGGGGVGRAWVSEGGPPPSQGRPVRWPTQAGASHAGRMQTGSRLGPGQSRGQAPGCHGPHGSGGRSGGLVSQCVHHDGAGGGVWEARGEAVLWASPGLLP